MFFRDEFYFLSNFFPCSVSYEGLTYLCVESGYQAAKTRDHALRQQFVGMLGREARFKGRSIALRPDWRDIRLSVMEHLIREKFYNSDVLRLHLINIRGPIIEDNTWNDTFWGRCNGVGENHLGLILMRTRDSLIVKHK